jgi:hypothetical protein
VTDEPPAAPAKNAPPRWSGPVVSRVLVDGGIAVTIWGPDPPTPDLAVGDVYWCPRDFYDPRDPKPGRAIVIVKTPTAPTFEAVVLTRTSDENAPGRWSGPLPALGLHLPGRWQPKDYRVAVRHFGTPYVTYLGTLPDGQLVAVLNLWKEGK